MTRASKTLHLQVLGHLGDGPHELFAVLLDLQGPEVLHTLQKGLEHDTSITANPTSAGDRHQRDLRVGTTQAVQPHTGTSNPD